MDEVFQQPLDPGSWWERHYVDVVSTDVQSTTPGDHSLLVQLMPGPRHPQWESIVSGDVDLGKRKPVVGCSSTNLTAASCSNITAKPEDYSDAGSSKGSKATPDSPPR